MKILITGAHFTPAQAVIEELKQDPAAKIVYIGRRFTQENDSALSVESQILPKIGVKFLPIIAGRLRRNIDIGTLTSLLKIPIGFLQAFYYLIKEKPEVVLSFGGYVGLPVVVSAWLLSIPVMIHEQTLVSGLANTISGLFASKIAVSFAGNYSFNKDKVIITGNPLRKELINSSGPVSVNIRDIIARGKREKLPLIYITGGNQGSHIINEAILEIIDSLVDRAVVIHQTGDSKFKDFEALTDKKMRLKFPQRYLVSRWIDVNDVGFILKNAGLAISRAGANTLLELAYFNIPTVVIPIPYLYRDEQSVNAKFFSKYGLCEVLPQENLSSHNLQQRINQLLKKRKAKIPPNFVKEDAAKIIAQETKLLGAAHV